MAHPIDDDKALKAAAKEARRLEFSRAHEGKTPPKSGGKPPQTPKAATPKLPPPHAPSTEAKGAESKGAPADKGANGPRAAAPLVKEREKVRAG